MIDKPENYNLLVEQWIPVLRTNGNRDRVGIRTALIEAGRIRQIAASNPMDNVALLRFLLTVLQWCKPNLTGEDRRRLDGASGIREDWLAEKLGAEDHPNNVFDLLGERGGFYQDDSVVGRKGAATNLLHDLPSGSKIAHFRHTRDGRDGLCLSCCALGLVRWSAIASAGTAGRAQSMTASLNGNTPAYSVAVSGNLLSTFLGTWPSEIAVDGDAPVWSGANEGSPLGFLKGMTWRSRRVLLAPPDEGGKRDLSPGHCCYCGEKADRLVRCVLFRPGWARPSKQPWSDDPHLLRITRKDARTGKEKKVTPPWASPDDPLEDHARVWRSVLEGLLQRSAGCGTGKTEFHTTLLAASQALYKQAATQVATLPEICPDVGRRLLVELQWLGKLTRVTLSAQADNWGKPPKPHFVVGGLCAPGAKGYAIRSSLCALSVPAECELEKAFCKLMHRLAVCGEGDSNAYSQPVEQWRKEAVRIIRRYVQRVVDSTTAGSPLRRREAAQRAGQALTQAMGKLARSGKKAPSPDAAGKPNAAGGSEAKHDSD